MIQKSQGQSKDFDRRIYHDLKLQWTEKCWKAGSVGGLRTICYLKFLLLNPIQLQLQDKD